MTPRTTSIGRRAAPAAAHLWRAMVLAVALFAPVVASADSGEEEPYVFTDRDQAEFLTCRVAGLLHLQAKDWENSVFSADATLALLDQISFVMAEVVGSAPPADVEDAKRRTLVAERFFISLRDMLAGGPPELMETARRDEILLRCVPVVWAAVRNELNELMKWRRKAVDAPPRGVLIPGLSER